MTDNPPTIRIEVRITGDGNDRLRIFQAPANTTDVSDLMARIGAALPEFGTVTWETGYLHETPSPNPGA
jgi:hypothetical protein